MSTNSSLLQLLGEEIAVGLRLPLRRALFSLVDIVKQSGVDGSSIRSEFVEAISETSGLVFPEGNIAEFDFALATGVGKTKLAIRCIEFLVRAEISNTFVILVHRDILKRRWIAEFTGEVQSRIGQGRTVHIIEKAAELPIRPVPDNDVIVVVQTHQAVSSDERLWADSLFSVESLIEEIARRGDAIAVVDESHHLQSGKSESVWRRNLEQMTPKMMIGLTATPNEFRPVIYSYDLRQLLTDGLYSKKLEFVHEAFRGSPEAVRLHAISRALGELEAKRLTLEQLPESHELKRENWKPRLLVAVASIEEVEATVDCLVQHFGIETSSVLAVSSKRKSDLLVELLLNLDQAPEVSVVVAAYMLDEGWDVTSISVICPLRALGSPSNARQIVGRGLRLPLGKRLNVEELDTLTVISIGQESLSTIRSEVTDTFGSSVSVRTGKNRPAISGSDEESQGSYECLVSVRRFKDWQPAETIVSGIVPAIEKMSVRKNESRNVAAIDAATGKVNIRVERLAKLLERPEAVRELTLVSPCHLVEEADAAIQHFNDGSDDLLSSSDILQVREELNRVSSHQFLTDVGRQLFIPEKVVTRSEFTIDSAKAQDTGWCDEPGHWYRGFEKSLTDFARFDTQPEFETAQILDMHPRVESWLRNDPKLVRILAPSQRYSPDFIVETDVAVHVLEIKGQHLQAGFLNQIGLIDTIENWCAAQSKGRRKRVRFLLVAAESVATSVLGLA